MNLMEKTSYSEPVVSIVTPSYNQGKYIEKTLLSVICQDYSNLEYIVVDAVSNDQTSEILSYYSQHIDTLIIEPDNGQSDALNKGLRQARGEILAYLNSDDCYASSTVVSEVSALFAQNPDIDVIYGQRNSIDAGGNFIYNPPYRPFSGEIILLNDYIPQECTFWRRGVFEKAGYYIDDSFQFAMDYELWLRLLDHGARFLSVENFFGLFRTYDQQKSIAQWHSVGLPEIARLQEKYLGYPLPERQMIESYQEHFFGANPSIREQSFTFTQALWGSFIVLKRETLRESPIDAWSFRGYEAQFRRTPLRIAG